MLDIATAYIRYKFLGHEFLTWLWYLLENESDELKTLHERQISLFIGTRIVLENMREKHSEKVTINGSQGNFLAGMLPLRQGALVTELSFEAKAEGMEWSFSIIGESLSLSNLKTAAIRPIETETDLENSLSEKIYLIEKVLRLIDNLFKRFLLLRCSNDWDYRVVPNMQKWIHPHEK